MKKIILGVAIAALTSTAVVAEEYRAEINLGFGSGELNDFVDTQTANISGEYFLESVDTSKGPYREAAFLSKSSSVKLDVLSTDFEVNNLTGTIDATMLSGRYVTEDDLIVTAGYTDIEDESLYSIGVGKYLSDTTELVFTYSKANESDFRVYNVDFYSLSDLSGGAYLAYNFGLVNATGVGGNDDDNFFSFSGGGLGSDFFGFSSLGGDAFGFSGGADYYFNDSISAGANIGYTDADEGEFTSFTLRGDYFISPKIRVGASYATNSGDSDANEFALGLTVRI